MDYILEIISGVIGNDTGQRWVFVVMVSGAVFALGISIAFIISTLTNPLRRRLSKLNNKVGWDQSELDKNDKDANHVDRYLKSLSKYVLPHSDKEYSGIQSELIRAGIRDESALGTYYAAKTVLLIVCGFIAVLITRWFPELTNMQILLSILGGAFIGFIIPKLILDRMEKKRIKKIRNAFADALDLFVVCVEAGLGLTATIQRVAKEMDISHPELAEELNLVSSEMRLGVDRIVALRGMAIRTGLDEIRGLVALIDQSVRFGTGIAETLRIYSEEFRDKRMQKAEETAAKISTKLIFPLTICVWPSFFLVAIGPAVLGVLEAIK